MRFVLPMTLATLALLSVPAGPSEVAQAQPSAQSYRALYDRGLRMEAEAAAAPAGEMRVRNYRAAAIAFEQALVARDRQGITDHGIYNALGTVYLGMGELARADAHLQRGLANARSMTPLDQGRLYNTVGYLYALRGDNVAARRYYQLSADRGNRSAARSLTALRPAQAR